MATDPQIETPKMPIVRPRIYIETSFISLLTARPSNNAIVLGHQQSTHAWWVNDKLHFDLCFSEIVLRESGKGDPVAAHDRLAVLSDMTSLELLDEARAVSRELLTAQMLPAKAEDDSLHIAIAAVWKVPYLLTWNLKHINNVFMLPRMAEVVRKAGYPMPVIGTPESLRWDQEGDHDRSIAE